MDVLCLSPYFSENLHHVLDLKGCLLSLNTSLGTFQGEKLSEQTMMACVDMKCNWKEKANWRRSLSFMVLICKVGYKSSVIHCRKFYGSSVGLLVV